MSKTYFLEATYSLNDYALGVPDDKLCNILGFQDGSGCGFGQRDISWYFKTEKARNKALKKACALKLEKVNLIAYEIDTD